MGHYLTYCGHVRLAKETHLAVLDTLRGLVNHDDDVSALGHAFFNHPRMSSVFANNWRPVAGLQPQAQLIQETAGTYLLSFCANSKADPDLYELLFDWLSPWIENQKGDLLLAVFTDDYLGSMQQDKVEFDTYAWTRYKWQEKPNRVCEWNAPWDMYPDFFHTFLNS